MGFYSAFVPDDFMSPELRALRSASHDHAEHGEERWQEKHTHRTTLRQSWQNTQKTDRHADFTQPKKIANRSDWRFLESLRSLLNE